MVKMGFLVNIPYLLLISEFCDPFYLKIIHFPAPLDPGSIWTQAFLDPRFHHRDHVVVFIYIPAGFQADYLEVITAEGAERAYSELGGFILDFVEILASAPL
jgi:hypothetical protein